MTAELKEAIDKMSQYEMAEKWRFGKLGDPMLQDDAGQYFAQRFKELGGFTPEISKQLGW